MADDDLWDVLIDLFGEIGIWFVPTSVFLVAIAGELIYHFLVGGWWVP